MGDIRTGYISSSMGRRGKARKARVSARIDAEIQADEDRLNAMLERHTRAAQEAAKFWKEQEELAILREQQMSTWKKFKRWLKGY